ncbi:hypothetical protein RHGRI_020215 [Rhododendron griersonianum]|uniref:Uncharacterized protein n=1 Tax=Rhododendron griersonianum TaxID=479676 RepID=A0AAV6JFE0_9ERIC|nr:hypothetical protein RHGRI_020215 [Rhododendron griersonianum]
MGKGHLIVGMPRSRPSRFSMVSQAIQEQTRNGNYHGYGVSVKWGYLVPLILDLQKAEEHRNYEGQNGVTRIEGRWWWSRRTPNERLHWKELFTLVFFRWVEARPLPRELVDGAVTAITAITSVFYILRPSLLAYRFVRQSLLQSSQTVAFGSSRPEDG